MSEHPIPDTRGGSQRLIVVSNRLPVVLRRRQGAWQARPGTGGLITALAPVVRDHAGLWVGWSGAVEGDAVALEAPFAEASAQLGFQLQPVSLTAQERDQFSYIMKARQRWW